MYPYTPSNKEEVQQEFVAVVNWIMNNYKNKETEK